jgi:opacity protein-like surface antigen
MKRLAGLSVLAILTIAIAVPAQDVQPNPYYPLKVGSEWTYKVQGGPIKVKVTGTEKAGTGNGFKLETSANNKVSATETVAYTKEGVQRFNVNGLNPEVPILFLPADPEATKEWNVDTKVAGQTIKGTFKVNKEKVQVPAGTYDNAIHVKGTDMEIGATKTTVEYWFAKDVGIVKLKFTLGSQDATLELEAYTAGK